MARIAGADVGAANLTVCVLDHPTTDLQRTFQEVTRRKNGILRIELTPEGIETLKSLNIEIIITEPTGLYSDAWTEVFKSLGIIQLEINTKTLRAYQESHQIKNKTDRTDAMALAAYGQLHYADPTKWIDRDCSNLKRTITELETLTSTQGQQANRIRQVLLTECPELYPETKTGHSCAWQAIHGITTKWTKRYQRTIAATTGTGISQRTQQTAGLIITLENEIDQVGQRLHELIHCGKWDPQLTIMEPYQLGPQLTAQILPTITPLEKLLIKPLSEHYYIDSGKRQRRYPALNAWKQQLGLGTLITQSGGKKREYMAGDRTTRKLLYMWMIRAASTTNKKYRRIPTPQITAIKEYHHQQTLKHHRPKRLQMMYTAVYGIEQLFWDLIAATEATKAA